MITLLVSFMIVLMVIGRRKNKFDLRDLLVPLLVALVQTALVVYQMMTIPWPE